MISAKSPRRLAGLLYIDSSALVKLVVEEPETHALERALGEEIDPDIIQSAAAIAPVTLRSLDAIHLASAIWLGADLGGFLTYDARLGGAAAVVGLPLLAPR